MAKYHYHLGILAQKCNQLEVAIQAYRKVIELDDNFLGAYNNLANILMKHSDKIDEAEAIYQKLIEIAPEHPGYYINLGNIFMVKKDYDFAIENYKKALNLKHQDSDIQHNLALAYQAKNDPEANFYFGYSKYRKNEYKEAISYFNKYLETESGDVNLYASLAECYLKSTWVEQSISTYLKGIKKMPDEYNLYVHLLGLLQHLRTSLRNRRKCVRKIF
jgi:tetratricopeptide (TPR) repeat protein